MNRIVNKGVVTESLNTVCVGFEYPVNSELLITDKNGIYIIISKGYTNGDDGGLSGIDTSSLTVTPKEDDMYIYELEVKS